MLHIFIETEEQMSNHEQISLLIPEEVEHRINERRILKEDIQKTIHNAETTGEKFINAINGRFLASMRPDRVTFWVEYIQIGNAYQIHSAYSHRMEMKRKGKP